jgi:hypothetical protein
LDSPVVLGLNSLAGKKRCADGDPNDDSNVISPPNNKKIKKENYHEMLVSTQVSPDIVDSEGGPSNTTEAKRGVTWCRCCCCGLPMCGVRSWEDFVCTNFLNLKTQNW